MATQAETRAATIWTRLQELIAAEKSVTYTFENIVYTVTPVAVSGSTVWLEVHATDANGALPTDNPYGFTNPPLGHATNKATQVLTAKEMVRDAVLTVARKQGWNG